MLIPSPSGNHYKVHASLSRRVNANSQLGEVSGTIVSKLIKKGEC